MARLHLALLLLILAVSTVIVSAVDKPSTTTAEAPATTATMPTDPDEGVPIDGPPDAIGTTDDDAPGTPGDDPDEVAVAGPIGSETSYANYPPPQQTPASGASSVAIGFGSVVVAMAGSFFF